MLVDQDVTLIVSISPWPADWASWLFGCPYLPQEAHILSQACSLTVCIYRLLDSLLTSKWIITLGTACLGIYLQQEQKVQLAQIIHQAVHPRPIHNDMQRLPCNTSTGPSVKVVAALLAFLSYTA